MKKLWVVLAGVILSSAILWLPFWLRLPEFPGWGWDMSKGMDTVFANFDGPNYLIVAKTWYDKTLIRSSFSNPLPLEYYPAHLPLYPALISVFNALMRGTWAMLFTTLLGSIFCFYVFFVMAKEMVGEKKAKWLCLVWLILPARWLVVRSVGAAEPWFIGFILASIHAFKKEKYGWEGIFGALAQLTKSPGILLFGGYGLYLLIEGGWPRLAGFQGRAIKRWLKAWPILLIPVAGLGLFYFYQWRVGDFLAYFHSGDNFHLFWPPFSIFSPRGQFWTGDFWLEEVIWIWMIYGLGILRLWKKGWKVEASFASVFYLSTLLVAHRDLSRYILPIAPLVLLGWSGVILKKEYRWLLYLLILPVFLYSWNFLLNNTAPIADWSPYL